MPSAYKSSAPVTNVTFGSPAATRDVILHTLVDHDGKPISDPWIEKTNNKANMVSMVHRLFGLMALTSLPSLQHRSIVMQVAMHL